MDKHPRSTPDDGRRPTGIGSAVADGSPIAWLAEQGLIAFLPVEQSAAVDDNKEYLRPAAHAGQEPGAQPEEALRIRLSAQKLWAEGRLAWTTADAVWLAELERSANGRHMFLRVWRDDRYVGYQDDIGWHPATSQRTRRSRPRQASLPLVPAG